MPNNTVSQNSGGNGFFASFGDALGQALGATAALLPVWAANQLDIQGSDQLANPTFVGQGSQNVPLTTQAFEPPPPRSSVETQIAGPSNQTLLILGGVLAGVVLLELI